MKREVAVGLVEIFLPDKGAGTILGSDGLRYRFFKSGRRRLVAGHTQPLFRQALEFFQAAVRKGDRVVFLPERTAAGLKAEIWGLAAEYDRALREIALREIQPDKAAS